MSSFSNPATLRVCLPLLGLTACLAQPALSQSATPDNGGPAQTTAVAPASAPVVSSTPAAVPPTNAGPAPAASTPANAPAFTVKISGFVRNDFIFDSRQTLNLREASVDLWPRDKQLDAAGKDINDVSSLNMLGVNSRLGVSFNGPDAWGAKTSGLLEMEWFGPSDAAVGGVRLRHAWAKLDWPKTQLGFGQYWHPLFVTDCFPAVLNFNTGIPFQPFNRSPQIRMTNTIGKDLYLITALIAQRDFTSLGPNGGSSEYMRNSSIPNLHAQLQLKKSNFVAGIALDYKVLRPRLSTGSGTTLAVSDATVGSSALMGYLKVVGRSTTIKVEAVSGSNMTDHVMLGGYLAYANPGSPTVEASYKPTNITSVWAEIHGNGKKVVPGLFVGYCKNNGTDPNAIAAYGRGIGLTGRTGIDNLLRVSPRVEFIAGKFKIGGEYEYTAAAFGTSTNDSKVTSTETIANSRLLLLTVFSF
ncbi:hypothetical protein J2I47_04450 [Fibrella sp. HMF5335]|uniref:Porin n=1 Tax=Fibrella rubiginis TaxID=2817060 RepID=A0A939GFZ2_9BACT|nr:hypothetical protein [Fibrella rubiginis]MBO0935792.1 hypothetical protein [Fibrella rubiginis]